MTQKEYKSYLVAKKEAHRFAKMVTEWARDIRLYCPICDTVLRTHQTVCQCGNGELLWKKPFEKEFPTGDTRFVVSPVASSGKISRGLKYRGATTMLSVGSPSTKLDTTNYSVTSIFDCQKAQEQLPQDVVEVIDIFLEEQFRLFI